MLAVNTAPRFACWYLDIIQTGMYKWWLWLFPYSQYMWLVVVHPCPNYITRQNEQISHEDIGQLLLGPVMRQWYFALFVSNSERALGNCVINSAPILAIQVWRFSNQGGELVKDETLVSCTQSQPGQDFTVPITIENEFSSMNKYSLIATINHSSTLNRGHY